MIKILAFLQKNKKALSLVKKNKDKSMQLLYSNYTNVFLAAELRKTYNLSLVNMI